MNRGISISELAKQIEDAQSRQKDLLVPTSNMSMVAVAKHPVIDIEGHAFVEPTDWAHAQLGQHLGIPKAYYDKLRSEAHLVLLSFSIQWFTFSVSRSRWASLRSLS